MNGPPARALDRSDGLVAFAGGLGGRRSRRRRRRDDDHFRRSMHEWGDDQKR